MLAHRFRGSLLGLAIGDALGTTLEFSPRAADELHTEIIGGGPFNLKAGEWTDDTSMALCLAHSLIRSNGFSAQDQMELYQAWWRDGFLSSNGKCFDIGNTILQALRSFEISNNPISGSADEFSAGNGALMRVAPAALFFASNCTDAIEKAGESSKTTHGNVQSIDACRYYAGLILGAINGKSKEDILSSCYSPVADVWKYFPLCDQVRMVAEGTFKNKNREQIKSSGYVIDSMEAALWAFYNTNTFEEGLIRAVNLGGDSDTIGAIYGQLAGAYYGEPNIPFRYIQPLKHWHYFYYFADELLAYYDGRDQLMSR
ncbi:MAG: ADP-ribosylglycohydrolase [Cellvibrio sp. 79]|nr:MAG: ADP-ribosylglycohydrolase [Cellvibrio sp. 79]